MKRSAGATKGTHAKLIEEQLRKKGWSQTDLAKATGLPRYTISRAVRGQNLMGADVLEKIAAVLQITFEQASPASPESRNQVIPHVLSCEELPDGRFHLMLNRIVEPGIHVLIQLLVGRGAMDSDAVSSVLLAIMEIEKARPGGSK